jgi:hypothetical protein
MAAGMYKAPTAEQVATLRERAVQFRLLARNQDMIAARLIAAAADLDADAKARELWRGE